MRWLCIFVPCNWLWHFNAQEGLEPSDSAVGVYQCSRCKTISIGSRRWRALPSHERQAGQ